MGDQKRWFKLWESSLHDDDLLALAPADRWRWAALGAYISVHGTAGVIEIHPENPALRSAFGLQDNEPLMVCVKRLPHVCVGEAQSAYGKFTVTWLNWHRYQTDTTVSERVKRLRSKRRGEERRKRGDPPLPPQGGTDPPEDPWNCTYCVQILCLLNERTARTYDGSGKGFLLIHAAHERHGAEACRAVVRRKTAQWIDDPKMSGLLRPATLFDPTHFDGYRNEPDPDAPAPGQSKGPIMMPDGGQL